MTISKIIVWLIIGALAGTLAGRIVSFSKQGLGFWTSLVLGMLRAVVGGGCSGCSASTLVSAKSKSPSRI